MNSVNILGVNVACISKPDLLATVSRWAGESEPRTIGYVNAHCLNVASTNPVFRALLNQIDLVYPDGISVVWASRFLGGCRLEKITGRDWIFDLCDLAQSQKLRIYILAGAPGIATQARSNLLVQWPRLQIVGTCDGYFVERSEAQVMEELREVIPQVLLVGMGATKQEQWVATHHQEIPIPIWWSVGALFDYVAGVERPVPAWMDMLALEWFWRFLLDPHGKWQRYLVGNPVFVARLLRQKFWRQ